MKKAICFTMVFLIFLSSIYSIKVAADDTVLDAPKIKVKLINDKTGVKITFYKVKNADFYQIYFSGNADDYKGYQSTGAKWICNIDQIKTKKYNYKISGLPKGKYKFWVVAKASKGDDLIEAYSSKKTIKIKEASIEPRKEKKYDFSNTEVGDIISFGAYEQDGLMTNGKEDIEWIVLSKTDGKLFLLSKYAIDCIPFADTTSADWSASLIRQWLNNKFYQIAFTKEEQNRIQSTLNHYGYNDEYTCEDNIFLLSNDELCNTNYGFSDNPDEDDLFRRCTPTTYAVNRYGTSFYVSPEEAYNIFPEYCDYFLTVEGLGTCSWWSRTSGTSFALAGYVYYWGHLNTEGVCAYDIKSGEKLPIDYAFGVRPAMWISIE